MSGLYAGLESGGRRFAYASLACALPGVALERLPRSLKILFENVVRKSPEALPALRQWLAKRDTPHEVPFFPARILMHDTTCLPALADFAAMRDAVAARGADPARINPTIPVDLVIDHSVMADHFGSANAADLNLELEFRRNAERYRFVKWAQKSLANFRVVPPGTGIIHQINMELLATVVSIEEREGAPALVFPDTLLGTDSHTPMINALGMLAWGVGGIEAQAAMVGEPVGVAIPRVVGVRLAGSVRAGVTATDMVLALTQRLRLHGVVGKFVEFFGPGVAALSLADRATIANMAPEYGATLSMFPQDAITLEYLRGSARPLEHVDLVEAYARAQGLWIDAASPNPDCDERIDFDLGTVEASVAGPTQPDQLKALGTVADSFRHDYPGGDGPIALAAITSCTNTSNPALVVGAGLLARNARRRGLSKPYWVKTTLSPGSRVVSDYLRASGLQDDLDALGFQVVGHGCMTCIGNSGDLHPEIVEAVKREDLAAVGVLSGNRNFQGRVNPHLAAAYLASPALVVAYALAGKITVDLTRDPLGTDPQGEPVYLRDLWPTPEEIAAVIAKHITPQMFTARYRDVWTGPAQWQRIAAPDDVQFPWDPRSTYIRRPPHVDGVTSTPPPALDIRGARVLLMLGDNVTTDHISPAGKIPQGSLAADYLSGHGVIPAEFNQYSTRRSNHEVMLRGAFSNPRLRNELLPENASPSNVALTADGSSALPAFEAAQSYRRADTPLAILAGRNYGAGSSRDWGAKAPMLLGVRAIVADTFERIHRSNLIGMGIVPLTFPPGISRRDIAHDGREVLDFAGLDRLAVGDNPVALTVTHPERAPRAFELECRIDSQRELATLRQGGFLPLVVRNALAHSTEKIA